MIEILSLGAGVQSSTLALMAAAGEITPMPDVAIFADTKAEPLSVYLWLRWLQKQLPFPIRTVTEKTGILSGLVKSLKEQRCASIPFWTESDNEKGGKLRRQCTREFKIDPIERAIREMLGIKKGYRAPKEIVVNQWIGISLDEVGRMKPSKTLFIRHVWPLIDRKMTRHDCLLWLERKGYPKPPRSACTFCPYHNDHEWRALKADPRSWKQIVAVDRLIRSGVRGTREKLYLHRSMKPIDQVDFSTEEENGQLNMFNNECEGMCGV